MKHQKFLKRTRPQLKFQKDLHPMREQRTLLLMLRSLRLRRKLPRLRRKMPRLRRKKLRQRIKMPRSRKKMLRLRKKMPRSKKRQKKRLKLLPKKNQDMSITMSEVQLQLMIITIPEMERRWHMNNILTTMCMMERQV